ncbi:response regulator transcription factor [Magnetospira thiophila]
MRILLVEDNLQLAALTRAGIEAAGFSVDTLTTVTDATEAIASIPYDALVLDLGLPDGNGLDLLHQVRATGKTLPVLILTARDGIGDRVNGLDSGADDYLLKPFAMEELVARLRALLRRPGNPLSVELRCGNLTFDTVSRQAICDGNALPLSKREGEVLEHLMRRAGRVIPKTAIEESLYGFEDEGSSNSVEALLSRLRRKMLAGGITPTILTIRGVGYMLTEPEP